MTSKPPSQNAPSLRLPVFSHSSCLAHRPPGGYPEKPERVEQIVRHLVDLGVPVEEPDVDEATVLEAVGRIHDARYVERLRAAVERGDGLIDSADNPLSPGTWQAAVAAVACALAAVDRVMEEAGHAFVAARPPGHHANAERAMGFCYLSNISVAAQYLLDRHGCERVAILDFDVHHGNGTQDVFWARGDVTYLSCHQAPFYPGTGRAGDTGEGAGAGETINVPMPAGSGDAEYSDVFDRRLLPALRDRRPDALLVSAGFDAWRDDPLGGMAVTEDGFRQIGTRLRAVADEACGGRMVSLLEGGYDVASLPRLVTAFLEAAGGQSGAI